MALLFVPRKVFALVMAGASCLSIASCGGSERHSSNVPGAAVPAERVSRFEAPEPFFPRGEGTELGLDSDALSALIASAQASRSDALILIKEGHVVVERYFGHRPRPIATMSVTKGIVSLAIGALIDEKKIASIDAPLATWFPEWAEGRKASVTLRHVMTHTSGLEHQGPARKLYDQADRLAYARQLPVVEQPGKRVSYNNEAVELLSGIVRIAAGKPLDDYMREKFFTPMGIVDFTWDKDKAGNVQAFADLKLFPRDLAKFGQLMLDGGRWNGQQLVSSTWIAQSTSPARADSEIGLLWWVAYTSLEYVQSAATREAFGQWGFTASSKLAPLDGRIFNNATNYYETATALLTNDEMSSLFRVRGLPDSPKLFDVRRGEPIGFHHDGSNGQFLLVYRPWHIVAVRLHDPGDEPLETLAQYMAEEREHGFSGFPEAVRATVRRGK
ncbi:beta-lactamase family protein [Pendulispora rubella]|uniref:Beta-lactamase family protein n=1 Tax=Pendulispora rubella TaxID=2741070 RepID=A0ABZ2LEK0_9BACT